MNEYNDMLAIKPISFPKASTENIIADLQEKPSSMTISNIDELVVYGKDFDEINHKMSFINIKELIFYSIDKRTFESSIKIISNCERLYIPDTIPKLNIYAKCNKIEELMVYDSSLSLEFIQDIANQ